MLQRKNMKLSTFNFKKEQGWSIPNFPDLDSENTLVLVFAAPAFIDDQKPLLELKKHYPRSKIIGCSSAGEITGPSVFDDSVSVAVLRFNSTKIKVTDAEILEASQSYEVGKQIAEKMDSDDLKGIFVLSDGLKVNGTELTRGLNTLEKKDVVITGGLAGDGSRFKQTWTIFNGEIKLNSVVSVGFYGDKIEIGHGSKGGWDIFGLERRITRSKSNILYELDNKPALELYKEYLGDRASGLPATGLLFPLAIRKDINDEKQLVRTILAVDEKTKSLTFAGDMPTGFLAQLMHANFDRLIDGANAAAKLASPKAHTNSSLVIAISCVGRKLLLGDRIEEETESTLAALPKGTQQIGFYSYGELSPYTTGNCDLHNQTMTLTTIVEED
jgi:hypothetical protein